MEAVIFMGIPASGKSTFYKERFFTTHLRLNLDMLKTRKRLSIFFRACLGANQRFVLDNTNISVADRAVYIQEAKLAHFQVIGYFFEPDPQRSQLWNATRQGKERVPDVAIWSGIKRLEIPTFAEGFDALYTVRIDDQKRFDVTGIPHEL